MPDDGARRVFDDDKVQLIDSDDIDKTTPYMVRERLWEICWIANTDCCY